MMHTLAVPSKIISDEKVVVSDETTLILLVFLCSSIGKAVSDGVKPRGTPPQSSTRFFNQNDVDVLLVHYFCQIHLKI